MSRGRRIVWSDDDSDDDEFPDLANLVPKKAETKTEKEKESNAAPTTAVRRRKLGSIPDNKSLLRAWTPEDGEEKEVKTSSQRKKEEVTGPQKLKKEGTLRKDRVELRTRKSKSASVSPPSPKDDQDWEEEEFLSAQEEVEISIIEDVSLADDSFHSCESEGTETGDLGGDGSEEEEDEDDSEDDDFYEDLEDTPPRPSTKSRIQGKKQTNLSEPKKTTEKKVPSQNGKVSIPDLKPKTSRDNTKKSKQPLEKDITDKISKLRLDAMVFFDSDNEDDDNVEATPPSTPPKLKPSQRSLPSPTKLPRIPSTPHRVSSDIFWSQEFVDDWNDQHSPVKNLFPSKPSSVTTTTKPSKPPSTKPSIKPASTPAKPKPTSSSSKKEFSSSKESLAKSFLHLLDTTITSSQLSQLSASTGGIHLIWTNKLSTTAGRANWKRIKSSSTQYTHHASIELSTKIISDPSRLLNVLAHEFCHLANFMISGITTNPHGKEFKLWAKKVTDKFGDSHGIEVTTKHSYEIDFKYVWSCEECQTDFKRHSKSIDTARHRCGVCKGVLKQIKPVPREGKGESEYQVFMKEEMKRVKSENKGIKQNEVMRIVALRWKEKKEGKKGTGGVEVEEVEKRVKLLI
ncbi:SprT-like family-domain-containing protein [Podospora fimiseda]|uniref:SprT-like family-domain-containing protein n=1 Tax=Podospora fimiseda TaxID=252190 RepID=A0AAN7BYJ8_9PEZI|nr:SprT-like family-domain-containing protein [Podospora fimiseda]